MFGEEKTLDILQGMLQSRITALSTKFFEHVKGDPNIPRLKHLPEDKRLGALESAFKMTLLRQLSKLSDNWAQSMHQLAQIEMSSTMHDLLGCVCKGDTDSPNRTKAYQMICGRMITTALLAAHLGGVSLTESSMKEFSDFMDSMENEMSNIPQKRGQNDNG